MSLYSLCEILAAIQGHTVQGELFARILTGRVLIMVTKYTTCANTVVLCFALLPQPQLGFITDGNSKLVGSARIRQVRVKRDTCSIAPELSLTVKECHASYSFDTEDMSDYGEHWNISAVDNSSELSSVWKYQSQSRLRGHPIWGKLDVYRGGGYVVHLGIDAHNASR